MKENSIKFLERPFSKDEVWDTIQSCDGDKALGPDEYNLNFFKKNWCLVKKDVMRFMGDFYRHSKLGRGVNNSFIILVRKVSNLIRLDEYRPISLVGSLYKIMVNTFANRLKQVMDEIIGRNQFAFIKGR